MADKKISELTAAGALTGTEPVPVVQGGDTVKTTVQDIADLGAGVASFPLLAPTTDATDPQFAGEDFPNIGFFVDESGNWNFTFNGVIKAIFGETIQFNTDSDNEPIPPMLITPDEDFGPQVLVSARLATGAHLITGGDTVAGLNVSPGETPENPQEGDIWTTAAGDAFIFINGVTKQFTLT